LQNVTKFNQTVYVEIYRENKGNLKMEDNYFYAARNVMQPSGTAVTKIFSVGA